MMRSKSLFYGIGALIVMYLIFRVVVPHVAEKGYGCDLHQTVYQLKLKCRITAKMINANEHNYPTIYYANSGNKYNNYIYAYEPEFNGLYDLVELGDSLEKNANSLYFTVRSKRFKKDTMIMFRTNCKDSLEKKLISLSLCSSPDN